MNGLRFQFRAIIMLSITACAVLGQEGTEPFDASNQVAMRPLGQMESDQHIVTIQELQHAVPSKARREMAKGEKARAKDQTGEAILHLERAIAIDPEYISARNNLATVYIKIGDPQAAISQLEAATKIDPHRAVLFHNMAVAYALLKRLDDAERAARSAIALGHVTGLSKTLLGLVLFERGQYTDEALRCLDGTEDRPWLRLVAARILIAQGREEAARAELQTYLASGQTRDREIAENWLDVIDHPGSLRVVIAPE